MAENGVNILLEIFYETFKIMYDYSSYLLFLLFSFSDMGFS